MRSSLHAGVALGAVASALCAAQSARAQLGVFMDGLSSPRHLTYDNGTVYVAEAGTGGGVAVGEGATGASFFYGRTGRVSSRALGGPQGVSLDNLPSLAQTGGADATGPSAVAVANDGRLYTLFGSIGGPALRTQSPLADQPNANYFGSLVARDADATLTPVNDIAAYEANNPDGNDVNSNPFGLAFRPGGAGAPSFAVADAGANAIFRSNVAAPLAAPIVQPNRPSPLFPGVGGPTYQSVPTGVAYSPDGNTLYTSELTGFPFVQGAARVMAYDLSGGAGSTPAASIFADGLTNLTDVAVGPDGAVYALSYDLNGLLAPGDTGGLYRLNGDGTSTLLLSDGLVNPTGLTVAPDGTFYISNFGTSPDAGQVVRFTLVPEPTVAAALCLAAAGLLARRRR